MANESKRSDWPWMVALGLIAVLLPIILWRLSGPLHIHFLEMLKDLALGGFGIFVAFMLAAATKKLWDVFETLASEPPEETSRRQR